MLLAIGILISSGLALTPRFDPSDVVRKIRSAHSTPRILDPSSPSLDGGEFLIDTSVTCVPPQGNQSSPAVAFDGANYLVVWQDSRTGRDYDIYGARVTPQGTLLDPVGFVISQASNNQTAPTVDFDGADFLVVWQDNRIGSSYDIYGARVTPQGTVLDSSGIVISQATGDQHSPDESFDGANFLVVWEDCRSDTSGDICGARVTPQGTVLDSAGFVVSHAEGGQRFPRPAFDGANSLVTWEDDRGSRGWDIYGARVTPQGTVLDSAGIVISQAANNQFAPAVGFDSTDFLVVWQDNRSGSDYDIYGARVTPQGKVLDSMGRVISQAKYDQDCPAVGFDGANILVAWEDYRNDSATDVYGARVTPQGTVLDTAGIVISQAASGQWRPALCFDGANSLVVWETGDIYGARVTPQGTVLDSAGLAISQAANIQYYPAVGFDGTNFLVVWEDRCNGDGDIYGARVTPQGTLLDPAGFVILQAAGDQYSPVLAFDGANFLVVWGDLRNGSGNMDIYGARVTPAGVVLDPSGIVISQAANSQCWPVTGFDGTNFLVVWHDFRGGTFPDIYGARVTPAGVVLDPSGIPISTAAYDQACPSLAFDGTDFLVVWEDSRNIDINIYGTRVTPAGVVLDPAGIVISQAEGYQECTAVGFDGTNFLVVWRDHRSGSQWDIYGARVTPQGTVLDSAGIAIWQAANYQYYLYSPAIGFDGANFLVVWENNRSGSDWDIYGAHVTPGGTVFDSGPVVSQLEDQTCPRLCCGSGSQMLLVYQGWAGAVDGKGYNNYRIWGKMNPSPAVEEMTESDVRMTNSGASIVRGVLYLPEASSHKPKAASWLLDVSGRKVLDLKPGANDVRALAPGVYFVREQPQAASLKPQPVRKVILTE